MTGWAALDDAARQGANVAHGLGRREAQTALPPAEELYASELLDSNTCGPCATVDGRTYATMADALEDYPGAGGYIGCDGGSRCRGTLVLVHTREAPPTLDNPGDGGPRPAPVDRTPQGPSGVGRPAHIDPEGNLIPQRPTRPPDPGTAPASEGLSTVDEAGRTSMPVEDLEPPVQAQPATGPGDLVDRDPELAQMSGDELDRVMLDPEETLERKMAAADEFDARQAGTRERVWIEEKLDAETLARYAEEQAAWEAAGGYVAEGLAPTGTRAAGRRIDQVKDEWSTQLHMDYLAAEDATRGALIARDKYQEYVAKYGSDPAALFEGPARVAYYYASRELRDHWESLPGGRPTFAEFAVSRGVADAKMTARANKAAEARQSAMMRADESAAGREKRARQKARDRAKRGPLTAGERLAREQARRDRIRAQERKNAALLDEARDPPEGRTIADPEALGP